MGRGAAAGRRSRLCVCTDTADGRRRVVRDRQQRAVRPSPAHCSVRHSPCAVRTRVKAKRVPSRMVRQWRIGPVGLLQGAARRWLQLPRRGRCRATRERLARRPWRSASLHAKAPTSERLRPIAFVHAPEHCCRRAGNTLHYLDTVVGWGAYQCYAAVGRRSAAHECADAQRCTNGA